MDDGANVTQTLSLGKFRFGNASTIDVALFALCTAASKVSANLHLHRRSRLASVGPFRPIVRALHLTKRADINPCILSHSRPILDAVPHTCRRTAAVEGQQSESKEMSAFDGVGRTGLSPEAPRDCTTA